MNKSFLKSVFFSTTPIIYALCSASAQAASGTLACESRSGSQDELRFKLSVKGGPGDSQLAMIQAWNKNGQVLFSGTVTAKGELTIPNFHLTLQGKEMAKLGFFRLRAGAIGKSEWQERFPASLDTAASSVQLNCGFQSSSPIAPKRALEIANQEALATLGGTDVYLRGFDESDGHYSISLATYRTIPEENEYLFNPDQHVDYRYAVFQVSASTGEVRRLQIPGISTDHP